MLFLQNKENIFCEQSKTATLNGLYQFSLFLYLRLTLLEPLVFQGSVFRNFFRSCREIFPAYWGIRIVTVHYIIAGYPCCRIHANGKTACSKIGKISLSFILTKAPACGTCFSRESNSEDKGGIAMKNWQKAGCLFITLCIIFVCLGSSAQGEEQALKQAGLFAVSRIAIAEGIDNKEPVGTGETFPASAEKVYCFIEATDIKADTTATFVWFYGGKEVHSLELPLQEGSRWRTFSYKNLRGQAGEWKVEIRDAEGTTVKSVSFKVE